jgi:hypothetical protein
MTVISFFNKEDRALIDKFRIGTPEYRQAVLRHLELLVACMVDEGEKVRLTRLIKVLGREAQTERTGS